MTQTPAQSIASIASLSVKLKAFMTADAETLIDLGDGSDPIPSLAKLIADLPSTLTNQLAEIQSAVDRIGSTIGLQVKIFRTKEDQDGNLAFATDTVGWVYADPVDANNRFFVKQGASGVGSWEPAKDRIQLSLNLSQGQPGIEDGPLGTMFVTDEDGRGVGRILGGQFILKLHEWSIQYIFKHQPEQKKLSNEANAEDGLRGYQVIGDGEGRLIETVSLSGKAGVVLDTPSIAKIEKAINGWNITKATLLGFPVFNHRRGQLYDLVSYQDRAGAIYDIRQLKGRFSAIKVPKDPRIHGVFWVAQSNGMEGGSGHLSDETLFPFTALGLASVPNLTKDGGVWGLVQLQSDRLQDFSSIFPYLDMSSQGWTAENSIATMSAAVCKIRRDHGDDDEPTLYFMSHLGGQPLSAFLPHASSGYYLFENLVAAARGAKQAALANGYGGTDIDWLTIQQGETGPTGRTIYYNMLMDYRGQILPAIQAETGQQAGPVLAIVQTTSGDGSPTDSSVNLAQWDAYKNGQALLIGPVYHCPLYTGDLPAVHETPIGRRIKGEMCGYAYWHWKRYGWWKPLAPVSATAAAGASVITVIFDGPTGFLLALDNGSVRADGSIVERLVPDIENFGISYNDGSGRTISAITITASNALQIHLSGAIGSNATLGFGVVDRAAPLRGYATRATQLMAEFSPSPFERWLYNLPKKVRHCCVICDLSVTTI